MKKKLTIALLSGGVSSEREVSLNSGRQVYDALDQAKYDILRYDPKTDLPRLVADASRIDAAGAMLVLDFVSADFEKALKGGRSALLLYLPHALCKMIFGVIEQIGLMSG